jgi:preprotein translocase subunit SecA
MSRFKADIDEKRALAGTENINTFIRYQYLQAIDRKWLDHLENLESLREAVYLRSYAQKNPLTEYKLEGFDIFYKMLDEIRLEIASRLFLVKVKVEGEAAPARQVRQVAVNAQHSAPGTFNGSSESGGNSGPMSASKPESVQVVRSVPKVGRNDPCPCGSGKKYKFCHGK